MRLLDLYSCQGGASEGYRRAGFKPYGVDIAPQPRYPFPFVQSPVATIMGLLLAGQRVPFTVAGKTEWLFLADFAGIHASPPCQGYTLAQRIQGREHPDLIDATRDFLEASGLPWIMENVEGAPLRDPVMLCGAMFPSLRVYRHRLFESNIALAVPDHPPHVAPLRKMGRPPADGDFMHVVGNFSGVAKAKAAMGIDWMNRDGLRESIPPAFTEYLGQQLAAHIARDLAVAA
jgi:DNA (cytosine-5)-methyltransferase 1